MTKAEVERALAEGEGPQCEFKRQSDNLESMAGEVVAFANSDGGVLWAEETAAGAWRIPLSPCSKPTQEPRTLLTQ